MPLPPIDPSFAIRGPEWGVGQVGPVDPSAAPPSQQGFGGMLTNAIAEPARISRPFGVMLRRRV